MYVRTAVTTIKDGVKPGGDKNRRVPMPDHVYKTIELVGSSSKGMEDAVQKAIAKAATTVRNLRWFEVTDTRGHIEKGRVAHWQVTLKLGFTLEDE
jgi:flavin-binding protein dodecin